MYLVTNLLVLWLSARTGVWPMDPRVLRLWTIVSVPLASIDSTYSSNAQYRRFDSAGDLLWFMGNKKFSGKRFSWFAGTGSNYGGVPKWRFNIFVQHFNLKHLMIRTTTPKFKNHLFPTCYHWTILRGSWCDWKASGKRKKSCNYFIVVWLFVV